MSHVRFIRHHPHEGKLGVDIDGSRLRGILAKKAGTRAVHGLLEEVGACRQSGLGSLGGRGPRFPVSGGFGARHPPACEKRGNSGREREEKREAGSRERQTDKLGFGERAMVRHLAKRDRMEFILTQFR